MKSSIARRADLATAFKRFKKGEHISLEDLARLWGVSKARFVNVRNDIADFPDPVGKDGNALLYDAKPAIEALIRHETRHDTIHAKKSSKVARILGAGVATDDEELLPPTELLSLARAGAERDKRIFEQGLLVKFTDVQEVAQEVFGEISSMLSKLSDQVDPNGKLPANVRGLVDGSGKDLLLRIYNRLNDMLGGNADSDANRATADRAGPGRARRPRVRKGPARRVRTRA